jgi:branched-chain amino acid transport system permease protein
MEQCITTTVNVLILAAMYILVALGFAFIFSIMGILNFAHGSIYMIGGYICYQLITAAGLNSWLSLILTTIIMAVLGVFLERFSFRPFIGNFNRCIMICVAITTILESTINITSGTKTQVIPAFIEGVFKAGPITVSYEKILTFAIGAILLLLVIKLVNGTRVGQQMQAISQNKEAASLQGISVNRVSAFACALGCALAGISGCMMGAFLNLSPYMGQFILLKVMILVILAGVGSISGIFYTGLLLGSLDAALPVVLNGSTADAITVTIIVVILLIRPQGFWGHAA